MPSSTLTPDRSPEPGAMPAPTGPAGPQLVTVPGGWPPYDCEVHGAACPAAREAAGVDPYAGGRAARPGDAPGPTGQRVVALRPYGDLASPASAGTVRPAGSPAIAGVTAEWPRQFARVLVEILAGSRPPRQMTGWTTDRVRARIDDLTRLLASEFSPRIRRIVTSRPAACVVEMTVVVSFGPRARALAIRLEHMPARRPAPGLLPRPARWLCTEIETG